MLATAIVSVVAACSSVLVAACGLFAVRLYLLLTGRLRWSILLLLLSRNDSTSQDTFVPFLLDLSKWPPSARPTARPRLRARRPAPTARVHAPPWVLLPVPMVVLASATLLRLALVPPVAVPPASSLAALLSRPQSVRIIPVYYVHTTSLGPASTSDCHLRLSSASALDAVMIAAELPVSQLRVNERILC